jgi:hypothetical protein
MKWSFENTPTWSSDWPKEWLFSVQSSLTTTLMNRSSTTEEAILNAILRKIWCYGVRIDTHLLETKVEVTYGTKDDLVSSHIQDVPTMNPKPRLPTKVSFKGGSPPNIPNPSFFLASQNLGTRFLLRVVVYHIPKFGMWKKTMFACLDLKFHKDLKLLIYLRDLLENPFQTS